MALHKQGTVLKALCVCSVAITRYFKFDRSNLVNVSMGITTKQGGLPTENPETPFFQRGLEHRQPACGAGYFFLTTTWYFL